MDFCAVLIGQCKANVAQFSRRFAFVAEAMGLNICNTGKYNSSNKVLYGEEAIS